MIETLGSSGNTPKDAEVRELALAVSYFALGKYDQAARYYEKLAQMLPDDAVLRLTWAVACEFMGSRDKPNPSWPVCRKRRAFRRNIVSLWEMLTEVN